MRIKLRGKHWDFRFERIRDMRGYCEPPTKASKKIVVEQRLGGYEQLEVIIHEALHACHWDHCEEAIEETAADVARLLWNLGYRKEGSNGGS